MQCIEKPVLNISAVVAPCDDQILQVPANPYTNLYGAILGYFSAHTVERVDYILK
jgi:hypothetical protein